MDDQLTMDDCIALVEGLIINTVAGSETDLSNLPIVITAADAESIQTTVGKMSVSDNNPALRLLALVLNDNADADASVLIEVNVDDLGSVSIDDVALVDADGYLLSPFDTAPDQDGFLIMQIPCDLLVAGLAADGIIDYRVADEPGTLEDLTAESTTINRRRKKKKSSLQIKAGGFKPQSTDMADVYAPSDGTIALGEARGVLNMLRYASQVAESKRKKRRAKVPYKKHPKHALMKRKAQSLLNIRKTLRAGHQNRLANLAKHQAKRETR